MIVPNVKCVLGETLAMQDAWRRGFEGALSQRVLDVGAEGISSADERAEWTAKMEILSGGRNTIKWVNDGGTTLKYWPSIVVVRPAQIREFYLPGAGNDIHPAFVAGSKTYSQYYMGKYPGPYVVSNGKTIMLSLYGFDGMSNMLTGAYVEPNYNNAVLYGKNGGNGCHAVTNAEWMEIAMSCLQDGFQPKGNNSYGKDYQDPNSSEYYGVPAYWSSNRIARVLTGSGPLSWTHDGTPWGVWGMNGNFYQWTTGFRQNAGEIQVIPNNDAALPETDHSDGSEAWKAMLADGTLVAPGTDNTLKYDATSPISIVTEITSRTTTSINNYFGDVTGIAPNLAKLLGIAPAASSSALGSDRIYIRNDESGAYSETLSLRGGYWLYGSVRGVFSLNLNVARSYSGPDVGARPAFL
jgi:sulfatase modifying factor 1